MDVREKLVKLCDDLETLPCCDTYEGQADYLIAHGVTVQGWISVKDRLPVDSAAVNLYTRSRIVGTGFYDKHTKSWVQYYSGGAISVDVTHWQPMPQPRRRNGW